MIGGASHLQAVCEPAQRRRQQPLAQSARIATVGLLTQLLAGLQYSMQRSHLVQSHILQHSDCRLQLFAQSRCCSTPILLAQRELLHANMHMCMNIISIISM